MNRMVTLGNLYKMWEDEKSKKLAQMMSQALEGQVWDDWQEIMSDWDDWDTNEQKKKFIGMLQESGSKTFGPKAFKQQCTTMEDGKIKIPEQSLCTGT